MTDPWPGVEVVQDGGWVQVGLGLRTQQLHPHQAFALAAAITEAAEQAMAERYRQAEARHGTTP